MSPKANPNAASASGLHIDPPLFDPQRQIAKIEAIISAASMGLPQDIQGELGELSFSSAWGDREVRSVGQIRSEPIGESAIEFRHSLGIRDIDSCDVAVASAEVVRRVLAVAAEVPGQTDLAKSMRREARASMEPTQGGISPMRLRAIGLDIGDTPGTVRFTLDVAMLSHDLKFEVHRVRARDLQDVESLMPRLVARHLKRRAALEQAMAAGGVGWIDDAALTIMNAAGLRLHDALGKMEADVELNFCFGGDDGFQCQGQLHWEDGTIRGYVSRDADGAYFQFANSILRVDARSFPSTIIASLVGRRLGEVIDVNLIPSSAVIVGINEAGRILDIQLEIGRTPIPPLA